MYIEDLLGVTHVSSTVASGKAGGGRSACAHWESPSTAFRGRQGVWHPHALLWHFMSCLLQTEEASSDRGRTNLSSLMDLMIPEFLSSCVTLGKFLTLLILLFSHLWIGHNIPYLVKHDSVPTGLVGKVHPPPGAPDSPGSCSFLRFFPFPPALG